MLYVSLEDAGVAVVEDEALHVIFDNIDQVIDEKFDGNMHWITCKHRRISNNSYRAKRCSFVKEVRQ